MTMAVMAARIDEIRATISQLTPTPRAVEGTTVAPSAVPTATGDDFAGLLAAATGGTSSSAATASVTGPAPVSGGGATATDFVSAARRYLGVPYVWGGESLAEGGVDCSGLVQLAMKDVGVDVPRTARQQMTIGTEVPSLAQAVPGDLIVTRGGGHIMIYLGDNQVLHAPRPGQDVQVREMFETDADITSIRRVLPSGGQDLATAAARASFAGVSS